MKNKRQSNRESGSILILVMFAVVILSLIGVMGLNKSKTEIKISRNYFTDKTAFFAAEDGVSTGTDMLRNTVDPPSVIFGPIQYDNAVFRSGPLYDRYGYKISDPQYVEPFLTFKAPPPVGISIETSGSIGVFATPWKVTSSSSVATLGSGQAAKKEITSIVVLLSSEY